MSSLSSEAAARIDADTAAAQKWWRDLSDDPASRVLFVPGIHAGGLHVTPMAFAREVLIRLRRSVYLRQDVLGEVTEAGWRPLSDERLRAIMADVIRTKTLKDRGEKGFKEEESIPTVQHAALVSANAAATGIPRVLKALCSHPVIERTGSILGPGWHEHHGLLVTNCEVASSARDPWDLLADFPLDDYGKAGLLALLLTIMAKPTLGGASPMWCVTAAQERTGKTKLVNDIVGGLMFGGPIAADTWPKDEDEVRKVLHSAAIAGIEALMIDNVPSKLDSASLAAFVTALVVAGRILGRSEYITVPNNITPIITGNHVQASPELAKRCVVVELQSTGAAPELRTGWKHPDLPAVVAEARPYVLRWLLDLAEAWRPGKLVLGGFERWAGCIGGMMHGYPLLVDRAARIAAMSEDDTEALICRWKDVLGDGWVGIDEVLAYAMGIGWGGERLDPVKSARSRETSLGKMLKQIEGRWYGDSTIERRILGGSSRFRVVTAVKA